MILALSLAVLALCGVLMYLADRGLANTAERLAIALLRYARRTRERRSAIQEAQSKLLASVVSGKPVETAEAKA
jgi:hypothetical protein